MKRAFLTVLDRPPYNGLVMKKALERLGFKISDTYFAPRENDLIVTWNRYQRDEKMISAFERAGAKNIVVENGYLGREYNGELWYAMSRGQHNGAGLLPPPDLALWPRIDFPERPWNKEGREIVIFATRFMGSELVREPQGFAEARLVSINTFTGWKGRIRAHPGAQANLSNLELLSDVRDCYATCTWGSSAGLKSIFFGVPVFYGMRKWIGRVCACHYESGWVNPYRGDRDPLRSKLATAMWSLDEIARGEPFERLLSL